MRIPALSSATRRALLGLLALHLTQLVWVAVTNFGGYDEWMVLELNSRNVVSVPYCHRPLNWIWSWPAARLATRGFFPFTPLFTLYTTLSAFLVFGLVRRLVPDRPLLALLAGSFSVVWAPGDLARLSTVDRALYAGETFGVLGATALLVESWLRGRLSLLVLGMLAASVVVLSYEGTLPLLLGAPLFLLCTQTRSRRLLEWSSAWVAAVLPWAALYAWQMWRDPGSAYQISVLGIRPDPVAWARQMALQYAYHVFPLALTPLEELRTIPVAVAVAAFLLVLLACRRFVADELQGPPGRRLLAACLVVGLCVAGLAYSLIVLGVAAPTAFRLQILSGPGMALALATAVLLAAGLARGRARAGLLALLSAWIVTIGTGRTVAMQRRWDRESFYPRQARMLAGLTARVPDAVPHTLVILLDEGRAWRATFGFHHAVQYLYERRAAGYVRGVWDALYPVSFRTEGVRLEPWPVNRAAWDAPPSLYGYDELIVARHAATGELELLRDWPSVLPPLPPGARYAPLARLAPGPLPRRAILGLP